MLFATVCRCKRFPAFAAFVIFSARVDSRVRFKVIRLGKSSTADGAYVGFNPGMHGSLVALEYVWTLKRFTAFVAGVIFNIRMGYTVPLQVLVIITTSAADGADES